MGDSTITIIAIFLAAILMFVFPLMAMSDRADDVSQLNVQTLTTEFVDNVRTTGKLTEANYSKFIQQLDSTGNTYDVELEAQILDENPGKKATQADTTKIGENVYYNVYTSQILEELGKNNIKAFKEGDIFSVSAKNTNATISQQLKNAFYRVTGNDTYQISASHSGIVTVNGN
ncbi:MAG: hypothetical protein IKF83_03005 [Clostridia bacterium]|nr:hypothetical protein [Clostridia bacterium]